jgi:putative endonuclease
VGLNYNKKLGIWGESQAAQFLISKGYSIIDKNYSMRLGEIDLVATQGEFIVFIEVKTRRSEKFGSAESSITWRKRQHARAAIEKYLQVHTINLSPRYDVIIVDCQSRVPQIRHLEAVEI